MEEIYLMSVKKDVETSDIEELYYWAASLGLSVQKNESSLKRAIYKYYGVKDTSVTPKKDGSIEVSEAEYSTYYTVESVDENIAEFEGRVSVVIVDDNNDTDSSNNKTHRIVADKINFNRSRNSFTAIGNVEYITESPGVPPENIKGESMTFDIDSWRGSILKCISKQEKEIKGKDGKALEPQTFYYVTGEIKKSSSEVMGMDDVFIQTVEGSPYFNVSSTDMWMLNSSDYLIFAPFIKIGHVPVLWIPFYYHTENSLYFNPLYGYDTRRGAIFNNTVYLIGKKEKKEGDTDFSFLAYNMKETTNYDMNNMTLVPNDDATEYSKDYLKFMFDYYSKLGLYFGSNGNLTYLNDKLKLSLDSGIAFSRTLDNSGDPVLTGDFNSEYDWNTSYIFDTEVPYRYIFELSLESPYVNMDFKGYSDIYFKNDFYDRGEDFLWVNYFTEKLDEGIEGLGTQEESDESGDSDLRSDKDIIKSYSWGLDIVKDLTFSPEIVKPYFTGFKLSFEKFKMNYDVKKVPVPDNYVTSEDRVDDYFIHPESLIIPFKAEITGNFFDSDFKRTVINRESKDKEEEKKNSEDDEEVKVGEVKEIKKEIDPLFKIDNPYITEEDKKDEYVPLDPFEVDPNDQKKNIEITGGSQGSYLVSNLGYNLKADPNFNLNLEDSEWNNHQDIEYEYSDEELLIKAKPTATLDFNFKTRDDLFVLKDTLTGSYQYQEYLVNNDQEDLIQNYKQNETTLLKNTIITTLTPTKLLSRDIHTFSIKHNLEKKLFERLFDQELFNERGDNKPVYKDFEFEWEDERVEKHNLVGNYIFKFPIGDFNTTYTRTLPPKDETDDLDTTLKLGIYDVSSTHKWGFLYDEKLPEKDKEQDDFWKYDDLTWALSYKPIDQIDINSTTHYSFEEEELNKLDGGVSLYGASVKFTSRFGVKEEFNPTNNSWTTPEEEEDTLFLDYINMGYKLSLPKTYFWKNRITLNVTSNLNYTKHLVKVTQSKLNYDLSLIFGIYQFLDLSFNVKSENNSMFLYFKEDREKLDITDAMYNTPMYEDLLDSFKIWDDDARRRSKFNMESLGIGLTYKTPDWDFKFRYDASPKLEDKSYVWYPIFSFFVEWKPLKMVKTHIENEDEKWTASTKDPEDNTSTTTQSQ